MKFLNLVNKFLSFLQIWIRRLCLYITCVVQSCWRTGMQIKNGRRKFLLATFLLSFLFFLHVSTQIYLYSIVSSKYKNKNYRQKLIDLEKKMINKKNEPLGFLNFICYRPNRIKACGTFHINMLYFMCVTFGKVICK